MTDEQFKQLMDKLDAIERRLPPVPGYAGHFPTLLPPGQCAFCGGRHGGGICPNLRGGTMSGGTSGYTHNA